MANTSIKNKILSISPYIEVLIRHLYWKNVEWFSSKKKSPSHVEPKVIDFDKVIQYLQASGVSKGSLLLVHSSFAALKGSTLSPTEVNAALLSLIGEEGTLAMPAMPKFKNSPNVIEYLKKSNGNTFVYDVKRTPIKTGLLPAYLHRKKGSIRSLHPINTMVAFGPLAESLMKNNLAGESPLACGVHSSWKRCLDNDAIIVSIGTDLTHSLTMIHVAEDVLDESWPILDWYQTKKFSIKDGKTINEITLRERRPKWGALHFAERTLCKDLMNAGILHSSSIDGVLVETIKAKELVSFLSSKNSSGYPYYWTGK